VLLILGGGMRDVNAMAIDIVVCTLFVRGMHVVFHSRGLFNNW